MMSFEVFSMENLRTWKLLSFNSYVGKLYFLNSTYNLYWIAKLNEDGLQTLSTPCIALQRNLESNTRKHYDS